MGKHIVKYRYIIAVIFVALIVVSCIFMPKMIKSVNYDLTSYLPEGYETYDGFKFLSKNFNIHGDVEIGANATYEQMKAITDDIHKVDGVTGVTWADMLSYLTQLEVYNANEPEYIKIRSVFTDAPTVDDGKAHNWAILVTLKYAPSSPEAINSFRNIKSVLNNTIGNNYATSGMTDQASALFDTVFDEMWVYMLIAGIVVLIILIFATNSLMEPIILFLTLGISIVLNLGTNALFKSTSIITFACTAILQLGLSMDYAIFLLHQYRAELKKTVDPKEALANAIPKSAKTICASALTTVGGFLALLCMKFGIGSDLGLSLAKGILCSLATVLLLQPCLMLLCDKARIKTAHRCLDFKFRAPVKRVIRDRKWVAGVFAILFIPVCIASTTLSYAYLQFLPPSKDTSQKTVIAQTMSNQMMIIIPNNAYNPSTEKNDGKALVNENYEFVEKVQAIGDDKISFMLGLYTMIPEDRTIKGSALKELISEDFLFYDLISEDAEYSLKLLMTFMNIFDEEDLNEFGFGEINSYISNGYTIYTVGINPEIDNESEESFAIIEQIKSIGDEIFEGQGKVYMTGYTQSAYDFAAITPNDFMWVSIVSIVAIFVILMLTLRKFKFSLLLVAVIEFGIWLNFAMQYIFSGGTVNFMAYLIINAIQLGATVDYAILLTTKYKENRVRFEPRQSAYLATTSSVMSILTSALIMAGACFSVFFVSTNLVLKEMTFLMARGSLISSILVIFVLPALLVLLDKPKSGNIHFTQTPKLRPIKFKWHKKEKAIEPSPTVGKEDY